MWQSFFYLGNFLGSTGGGMLVSTLSFPWTSTILAGLFLALLILDSTVSLNKKCAIPINLREIPFDHLDDHAVE